MRRSVGIVAIVGVLLHALALVHHHAIMVANALPSATPAAAAPRIAAAFPFGNVPICRGNGTSALDDAAPGAPGEDSPSPAQRPLPCPVCSGSAAVYAIAPSPLAFLSPAAAGAPGFPTPAEHPHEATPAAHPPARAPPLSA
jgi:hypothetical protein